MNLFVPLDYNKKPTISKVIDKFCVNSMEGLENAGVLLPRDVMFIDFDGLNENEERYIKKLKEKYPETWVDTDRGSHFYFKKPAVVKVRHISKKMSTCGLIVDFCCPRFGVIKLNGVERKRSWNMEFNDLPVLPDWLLPLKENKKYDDPIDMLDLGDGDARNTSMYYWLKRVKRISGINLRDVAQFINTHIFKEQLDAEELANIYHNATNLSGDFENMPVGEAKNPKDFANWLIEEYKVRKYKGSLWHLDGLGYIADDFLLAGKLNKIKQITENEWKKIIFQLNINPDIIIPDEYENNIIIDNGLIINGEFCDMKSTDFTPYYLSVFYDPNSYDKEVDEFLNWLSNNDRDMRNVIEEMFGHIILTENAPHAFFLITGGGENGKSTFLKMISSFAQGLHSYVDIKNFNNPNSLVRMMGKLVNIADDIDPDYLEDSKALKVIANGGELEVKTLFKDTYHTQFKTTLIFTANRAPIWKDKTHGLFRRLNIIHLDNTVKNSDPYYLQKLTTDSAKQYILRLALEGVKRFKENGMKVSYSEKAQETKSQYMVESDHILYWLEESDEKLEGRTITDVYKTFTEWGFEAGIKQISRVEFGKRLRNIGYDNPLIREGNKVYRKIVKM